MTGPVRTRPEPRPLPAASPMRLRWRREVLNAPAPVWWITATFTMLLAAATVVYPPYRGPDEPKHVDLVVALEQGFSPLWSPDSRTVSQGVLAAQLVHNNRVREPQHLAEHQLPERPLRASYEDAGGSADWDRGNQLVQHPPAYYLLQAGVLRLVPGWAEQPFDRVVGILRLVGVGLLAPLPLLAAATARRLVGRTARDDTAARRAAVLGALLTLGVPQMIHIGAGVSNDSLQNVLGAVLVLMTVAVATGDLSRRTAVTAGAVLGLGLLTKGLLLGLVPVMVTAYGVAWYRTRRGNPAATRTALLRVGQALGLAASVGGWWWVRNLVEHGRLQPSGFARSTEPVRGWGVEAWQWLGDFAFLVNLRYWFDEPGGGHSLVTTVLSVLGTSVVILLLTMLVRARPAGADLTAVAVAVAVTLVCLVTLLGGSYESFTLGRDQPALQGRYLFPGLAGLCAVTAVALVRLGRPAPRAVVVATLAWCLVVQGVAAVLALRLYWWPSDGSLVRLVQGLLTLTPWPPAVVALLLLGAVVTGALTARAVLRDGSRPGQCQTPATDPT